MDANILDRRLGRIEEDVKAIAEALRELARVEERLTQHRDSLDDHEERLRKIEAVAHQNKGKVSMLERVGWIGITLLTAAAQYIF